MYFQRLIFLVFVLFLPCRLVQGAARHFRAQKSLLDCSISPPQGDSFTAQGSIERKVPMPITRLAPEERLSGAVIGGGLIWLAGQVADDASLDAEGQTADILKQIDALLAEAGTDKRALLSVTIILADIRDAPAMNRAWDRWLDQAHKPARMTIEAALVDPNWKVEITGVALAP
jgi:enamine deaminase RidA (YjgF/YER057c/UK114 family)